jgi:hypothetical protein
MRAKSAPVTAAVLIGLGVGAQAMAAGAGHVQAETSQAGVQAQADCRVGGPPTQPYGERPPEGFLRYATRPVIIGCAELASGRRFELVGYQLGRGERSSLCIDQYDFETRITSGCGSNVLYGGGAIDGTSREETAGHVPVVAGAVTSSVARVIVRSEIDGRLRRQPAALVGIDDRKLLRMIGVPRPFGRYIAEIPTGARAATAEALGARGRTLGLAFFPGFRGPVGQGRACYTQPRVTRLRLRKPARVGGKNRLRIVATYPGGQIGSIDVSVGGRSRVHADLSPESPRGEGGRRVVTLPVSFARRGTVLVDVTAEGLPRSKRCSTGPLRRSALKTLVVRVK